MLIQPRNHLSCRLVRIYRHYFRCLLPLACPERADLLAPVAYLLTAVGIAYVHRTSVATPVVVCFPLFLRLVLCLVRLV